jgi:hypothetical protein
MDERHAQFTVRHSRDRLKRIEFEAFARPDAGTEAWIAKTSDGADSPF